MKKTISHKISPGVRLGATDLEDSPMWLAGKKTVVLVGKVTSDVSVCFRSLRIASFTCSWDIYNTDLWRSIYKTNSPNAL